MDTEGPHSDVTVDLYLRSFGNVSTQSSRDTGITRLERLRERGVVADVTVEVRGNRVIPDGATARTDEGRETLDQIERFRSWADQAGMSLESFFDAEETRSPITDEDYTTLPLPTMTLAEYQGEQLRFVAPYTDTKTPYTAADRLETLEEAETELSYDRG